MQVIKREYFSATFLRFLLAGGTAAAVNVGSRIGYSHWLDYAPAIVLAYLTGMVTAFVLNRIFVFEGGGGSARRQFVNFALVNLLGVVQTVAISLLLARWLLPAAGVRWHAEDIAHLVGVVVPVFTSFLGHKYFSFADKASVVNRA
ncbi:GtrA family protein [Parachitinimonas caeni]|uniref:GtrA family protein n=1 Tax=Parachitinimonas caeni TaxID=3031301 RepID=A0ABT7DS87_9NEIS|nr:GtrA family protein [Parachitinimonas caeni]MDK2122926.1 GtrA family protein [Parachitinimonas caeni]